MAAPLSRRMCRIFKRSYFVRLSSTDDFRIPGSNKKYLRSLESFDKSAKPHMKTLQGFEESVSKEKELSETNLQKKMENEDLERAVRVLEENKESFASLFRKSKFTQLGNPKNQILIGKIFDYMNNDLYIDFGGKFYCVCRLNKPVADLQSKFVLNLLSKDSKCERRQLVNCFLRLITSFANTIQAEK